MAPLRYVDVSTLEDYPLDFQDDTSALDVKKFHSDLTGIPLRNLFLVCKGNVIEDNERLSKWESSTGNSLVFMFSKDPSECLGNTDPLFNQLQTARVPEGDDNWLIICEKFIVSLKDLNQCVNSRQERLKEVELQLRLYARNNLDLVRESVAGGQMVLDEKLKRIRTLYDMACQWKDFIKMIDPEAYKLLAESEALTSLENHYLKYNKLTEKLPVYKRFLQTLVGKISAADHLPSSDDEISLNKVERSIQLLDTSCQKFKCGSLGDPGSEMYKLERKYLWDCCAESSEDFRTICQEMTDGLVTTCIAQMRSHLESLQKSSKIAEEVHLICYEDETLDIILEKCKTDIESSKDMFIGGRGLGMIHQGGQDDRRPSVVTTNKVDRDTSDEDDDESDIKIELPVMGKTQE